ncbi:MAG TPA: DUF2779 domain-containing protein [Methyloversatilis sp.]
MSAHTGLSKSKLLLYRQCPKRLWLQIHRPELAEESDEVERVMAAGTLVGEVARDLLPGGILIETGDLAGNVELTRQLLASQPDTPLFEATFAHDGVLVRTDLLIPDGAGHCLAEVKSSTRVKPYHLDDAAIQTWVAQGAGVAVTQVELAHINNRFVYPGGGDYRGLFTHADVTADVAERLPRVAAWVDGAKQVMRQGEPDIAPGAQCNDPFACPFAGYCDRKANPAGVVTTEFPVDILPRHGGLADVLHDEGFHDLRQVPEERLQREVHRKIWRISRTGRAEIADEGMQFARDLPWPRFYLDFETIAFAVPRWPGTRPYQQIPFQFSCHIEAAPGQLIPQTFLSTDGSDPRRAFAEALIEATNPALLTQLGIAGRPPGPILVYSIGFERGRVMELAAHFSDLAPALNAIAERMTDLLPITRAHYYHPDMRGSWSIKAVLPTLGAGLDYAGMAVADGGMAQQAYLEMIDPLTPPDRREDLRQGLLDYCALDTLALVRLVECLASGEV